MRIARRPFLLATLALGVAPVPARADVIPDGVRSLGFRLSVSNLGTYLGAWGFVIYPTSNYGFGYVFEPSVSLVHLMLPARGRRPPTQLHAIPRAAFDALVEGASRYPQGEHRELVTVVPAPTNSVVAPLPLAPTLLVPETSTRMRVTRTLRIATLTEERFDLVLEREVYTHRDGHEEVTVPARGAPRPRR